MKLLKNSLIAALVSISLFSGFTKAYEDVPNDSPYFYAVEYLRRNDVFKDTKLFKPDIIISKAEFVKYLVLLNSPEFKAEKTISLPFKDTRNNAWYAPYLKEAIDRGIISGTDEFFYPNNRLNTVQALELLFHSRSIPIPRIYVGPIPYSDLERDKDNQAMVMRAIELGIITPERPDFAGIFKQVSRIKAAHMIYKMDLVDLREPSSGAQNGYDQGLQKIANAWGIIRSNYVDRDNLDDTVLSDLAIRAMVDSLDDPYSTYLDATENRSFSEQLDGQFEGIGAYIALNEEGKVTIVSPIKGSPAEKAGVEPGDVILKVDDFDTDGATLEEVVSKIKGPQGTEVKLGVRRDNRRLTISVTRGMINIASVEYEVVGDGSIMHIKISTFNQAALYEFRDVTDIIENNKDIKGIIIDVRNDPGGLLDVSLNILNALLPNDTPVLQIQYNYFNVTQNTNGVGELKDYPMVVLINKGSASASEILAGALKEKSDALVIGETSFGKGTVQEINYFGDSSSLKITVAKWLTPNGVSINKNGIVPDIEVEQGSAETTDKQLARAIAELKKKIKR